MKKTLVLIASLAMLGLGAAHASTPAPKAETDPSAAPQAAADAVKKPTHKRVASKTTQHQKAHKTTIKPEGGKA